jgi:hypothetical protein
MLMNIWILLLNMLKANGPLSHLSNELDPKCKLSATSVLMSGYQRCSTLLRRPRNLIIPAG